MTGKVFVGANYPDGLPLSNPSYNPATITGTIDVATGTALTGEGGVTWTIDNQGLIESTDTGAGGIRLDTGGYVYNALGAVISGHGAIYVQGGVGTVVNNGSIAGTDSDISFGVVLFSGGSITNMGSASISGGLAGVHVFDAVGTVANSGSITGSGTNGVGIWLEGGGSVTNANGASIAGTEYGLRIGYTSAATGTVINDGGISATGTGGTGLGLADGGSVTNTASASITGATGIRVEAGAGTVVNSGSIAGTAGIGIDLAAGGSVTNMASAAITGGVVASGVAATVINDGRISNTSAGGSGVALNSGGSVTNAASASITGNRDGVILGNGGAPATVVNDGSIAATAIGGAGTGGLGVVLDSGGSVTNAASASITGGYIGVEIFGGAGTMINDGDIVATGGFGVFLEASLEAGLVTNAASASITGATGILVSEGAGTVANDGSIAATGTNGYGVALNAGGAVTNTASAAITGVRYGVKIQDGAGTVSNDGGITATGTGGYGVYLGSGGSVTNTASAVISGGHLGVEIEGGGTLINAGTIIGSTGTAVAFGNTGSNLLVLDPGAAFSGAVDIYGLGSDALELASAASVGTLSAHGDFFSNLDTIIVDSGAAWRLAGATVLDSGGLANGGQLVLDPSTLMVASLTGTGSVTIDPGSTLIVQGAVAAGETIVFGGAGGVLELGDSAAVAGAIDGYVGGDAIITAPQSVTNTGSISGSGYGVILGLGGQVTNAASATIAGNYSGVLIAGGTGTLLNDGSIAGGVAFGAVLRAGGSVTNSVSATITGGYYGVAISGSAGGVVNDGVIAGTYGLGVVLQAGGSVSNAASAAITGGYIGVDLTAGGTITNAGSITGAHNGAHIGGGAGTVLNTGVILSTGTHAGLALFQGGTISNASTGRIGSTGGTGIYVTGAAAAVVNAGHIYGSGTHTGVAMEDGGSVTNQLGGSISGATNNAIYIGGASGTVLNAGTVIDTGGTHAAINLSLGGTISNASTGTISGPSASAIYIKSAAATLVNAGHIASGGTHSAVVLEKGGSVTNQSGGTITGTTLHNAIYATGGTTTVTNYGLLADGVNLQDGGFVSNQSDGIISSANFIGVFITGGAGTVVNDGSIADTGPGGIGVDLIAGGTLTNAGTITGAGGTAVTFGGTGSNRLVLDPGFGFAGGAVDGSAGASNTLELASGASAGAVIGLGTEFTDFGAVTLDPGAQWTISGSTDGLASGQVISGFSPGDTIDLVGVSETISNFSDGTLSLGGTAPLTLNLPGSFSTGQFSATPSSDGTDLTVACFAEGTRIRTDCGEVAVERLEPGMHVVSVLHGYPTEVVWIGRRRLRAAAHPRPADVWPIRICADAFAPGAPHRDLWLSPDHAVFVAGVLIPVRHLVNGASVVQECRDEISYFHVELAAHDVLLAEGLPVESYLDTGNRAAFANGGTTVMLHADFARRVWDIQACARLVLDGAERTAARRMLLERAKLLGHQVTTDPTLHLLVDGRVASPQIAGRTYRFHLPPAARAIRLVSRCTIPAHTTPDSDDHRRLGVAVARVALDGREMPLTDPRLSSGWHDREPDFRWTDGDAGLALAGVRVVDIDVALTERYWIAGEEKPDHARHG